MINILIIIVMMSIRHFRMIELVGQKILAAAVIVGLSLGFGFLPAALAKKYFLPTRQKVFLTNLLKSISYQLANKYFLPTFQTVFSTINYAQQDIFCDPLPLTKKYPILISVVSDMISPVLRLWTQRWKKIDSS